LSLSSSFSTSGSTLTKRTVPFWKWNRSWSKWSRIFPSKNQERGQEREQKQEQEQLQHTVSTSKWRTSILQAISR
jgi:hypothetical protein